MEALPFHGHDDSIEDLASSGKRKERCRVNEEAPHFKYEPLRLENKWFDAKESRNLDDELTVMKFRAHVAFCNKEYLMSLKFYERCREILPANANLLLREVCESQVRCLLQLQRFKESQEIVSMLLDEKGNPQDSSLYALLSDISLATGEFNGAAKYLKKCVELHPDYAEYWIKIADLYKQLAASERTFWSHLNREQFEDVWYFTDMFFDDMNGDIGFEKKTVNGLCFNETPQNVQNESRGATQANSLNADSMEHFAQIIDGLSQDFIKGLKCSCFKMRNTFSCFPSLVKDTNSAEGIGVILARLIYRHLIAHNEYVHGSINERNFTDEVERLNMIHLIFWKCLMKITQCGMLSRACALLQKSIQYSKGFAKNSERKKLDIIKQALLDLTGSKEHTTLLIKNLEISLSTNKHMDGGGKKTAKETF